ncbi:MAG: GGDEF domain-containing protein [Bacillati bacterium ANGP1]|uniref:GGDEF domain-containing protein n=1 Tax=Candidatus Segetimicrobium genomatis TaxID=2569760 RepID=A0A537J949_9BACT|nr:MAG: GGDEF domain-containing protein [Terrabacteria group bacterium ANGP1]
MAPTGDREASPTPLPPLPTPAATLSDEGWVSLVRVLVLLALIPALWFGIIRVTAATWIVPLLGGYVLLLALCPRRLPLIQRPDLVVMLDLLVTTLLVVASGNLDSPFLYVYYLTILEAVARFNLRQALAASTATTAIIIFLWIQAGQAEALRTPGFRLGAFIAGGFLLALFSGILVQELRAVRERMQWAALLDRRLQEATAKLEDQLRELQFNNDLAARLSGELQVKGVLEILLRAFLEIIGIGRGVAYLCDGDGKPHLVATHGAAPEGSQPASEIIPPALPAEATGGEVILYQVGTADPRGHAIVASVPLVRGTHLRAWLCGLGDAPVAVPDAARQRIRGLAAQGTSTLDAARLHEQMKDQAATDSLTGLANRRSFIDRFTAELARASRTGRRLSIAMLDLNGFKGINDTHGHAVGDVALIKVAKHLARNIRGADLVARFGGDEFVLLFSETESEQAEKTVARLRIDDLTIPDTGERSLPLSLSWGIATCPEDGTEINTLLHVADRRLYTMKDRLQNLK